MARNDSDFFARLKAALSQGGSRAEAAKEIAEMIRAEKGYRWVGLYEVTPTEIGIIAWTGSDAPAFPRFPITQGLNGAAVASRAPVNVGDVREDPRYLATFGTTRSELIVPILDASGHAVGTIDVESERLSAFGETDTRFLTRCGRVILPLFRTSAQGRAAG